MNRFLIRLFLVATLLCNFLGSGLGVRAQGMWDERKDCQIPFNKSEEQVRQCNGYVTPVAEEPQSPVEIVFRSAPSSHRFASSRPTRLLPTHGGKPGKHHGRWAADEVYKPFKIATQHQCRCLYRLRTLASPPRLYYVIALRRLLC